MDPFLSQLAELCRAETTRVKWVFVPSHAIGHTLGERLALAGDDWANLRFVPPFDVALQMAAPFLLERGIGPAADEIGPALVMRLLIELPESVPSYFRRLAEQPRMGEALWATLRGLRMAGLTVADLTEWAIPSADKRAELRALLATYEAHLATKWLADVADVYREALRHLGVGPVLPGDLRIELPGVIWAPLERRLLEALPGTRLTPRARQMPGLAGPRRLATPPAFQDATAATDSERLAFLLRPADAPRPRQDGSLVMFRAGGKEAEVEEVCRRILRDDIRLDHVEVACATGDYVVLFWVKAQRHEWPVTIGPGLPITLTRPGRALLAFCDWIEGGLAAGGLRRLLQSGDVRVDFEDGPTAGQAARLLARSDATWGRETYAPAMAGLAASYRERAADPDTDDEGKARSLDRAAQAERLAKWIDALVGLVPEPIDGRLRVDGVISACVRVVEEIAAKTSELDGAAAAVLAESLRELGALGDLERPAREVFALVRDRVETLTVVGGDRARPGHLFVTLLRHAGYSGRSHTFVTGLEEGRVFPPLIEDAVLLDAEREALSPALATSGDRASEALHEVASRLAVLGGRVCLSFSCRDLREHRETFPSWLLLQALRLLKPGEDWTYQQLNEELGEPVSAVPAEPEQALSDAGWWLRNLSGVGRVALSSVHSAFPWLGQGELAEAARESETFTIYDGFVRAAGARLDPRASGRPVSATTLETLARCPFRHFLERGLGLEPIEDAEPQRDRWLDPMTRGVLLHELYAAILREVRQQGAKANLGRHGPRLRELGEARLRELRALIPPPSKYVFERERQEILDDLQLFLRLEAAQTGRRAVGLEVSFGAGPAAGEPLAQADPVILELAPGLRFRLRGRIDRIDRLADGTYEVVDYKTGRFRADDFAGTFAGGRLLQHALYGLAATQLLRRTDQKARVSASSYYLPTARGGAERITLKPASRAEIGAVVRALFDVLAAGAFVHTADKEDCRYCPLGGACGREPLERAERKIANKSNAVLKPYRELGEHE